MALFAHVALEEHLAVGSRLFQGLLKRITVVNQNETYAYGQFAYRVGDVGIVLSVFNHAAVLHSSFDQHCGLVEILVFEADGQRSVALCVDDVVVDVLLQQVEDGKEKLFFAGVVQGSPLVDVHDVDVELRVSEEALQNLHFII